MNKTIFGMMMAGLVSMTLGCGQTGENGSKQLANQVTDPTAACESAGGSCVAVYPGACANGHTIGADQCGGGVGVECCVPDAPAPACTPLAAPVGGANPAAVYCEALGYENVDGQCQLSDGTSCEEWAFYRGECGQALSFCALHGGTVSSVSEDLGGWTGTFAVCTLPDGKRCHEQDFAASCACDS